MDEDHDGYDTAAQVRAYHGGISDMTLWRWIKSGIFPSPDRVVNKRRQWKRTHRKLNIGFEKTREP
jgi:hypothetical protein